MPWTAAICRGEAGAAPIFTRHKGLLRPPASRQPPPSVHRRRHQPREDPVLALAEDARGPDYDHLDVAGRAQQPLLFVELQPFIPVSRLEPCLFVDAREVARSVDVGGRNVNHPTDPPSAPRATDP